MLERLMGRAKTSGREDDNKESIVKRFREFRSTKILFFLVGYKLKREGYRSLWYDRYFHGN